jgi:hypothetical protein
MKRLFQQALVILALASVWLPQPAWARPAKVKHHVQHHKVRHVKRHHAHRT